MPDQINVATIPEQLANATSLFEMWQLTGLAQTAVAQRTEEVGTSVDEVKAAVTDSGKNAVTAINGVKDATGELKTAVTDGGKNAVTAINGVKDATGELKAAVTDGGKSALTAINGVKDATGELKTAVTDGGKNAVTAINGVKDATGELKMSIDSIQTAVASGAERIAGAIYELTSELRNLCPVLDKGGPDRAAGSVFRQDEFFRISASENADDAMRAHLDQLEKTVDEAIRREKLAAFLEHIQRWEDLGSSPNPPRRRRK